MHELKLSTLVATRYTTIRETVLSQPIVLPSAIPGDFHLISSTQDEFMTLSFLPLLTAFCVLQSVLNKRLIYNFG